MARDIDGSPGGRRDVGDAVRGGVERALAGNPPARDLRIERLRVRVPAGANADAVGRAVAEVLERAVRERGRR